MGLRFLRRRRVPLRRWDAVEIPPIKWFCRLCEANGEARTEAAVFLSVERHYLISHPGIKLPEWDKE